MPKPITPLNPAGLPVGHRGIHDGQDARFHDFTDVHGRGNSLKPQAGDRVGGILGEGNFIHFPGVSVRRSRLIGNRDMGGSGGDRTAAKARSFNDGRIAQVGAAVRFAESGMVGSLHALGRAGKPGIAQAADPDTDFERRCGQSR